MLCVPDVQEALEAHQRLFVWDETGDGGIYTLVEKETGPQSADTRGCQVYHDIDPAQQHARLKNASADLQKEIHVLK